MMNTARLGIACIVAILAWHVAFAASLEESDRTDSVPWNLPGQGTERLYDGRLSPTCAWRWNGRPIEITTSFDSPREIGGVRFWAGRSWISCGVRKASFYADGEKLGTFEFRPAHTFKDSFAKWRPVVCREMRMVVEEAWETVGGYYMFYMRLATPHMQRLFDSPP